MTTSGERQNLQLLHFHMMRHSIIFFRKVESYGRVLLECCITESTEATLHVYELFSFSMDSMIAKRSK